MDLHLTYIADLVSLTLMDMFFDIGGFMADNQDSDRGKFYFSFEPDEEERRLGNSFLRLVLECILVWHLWYPLDAQEEPTQFKQVYDKLVEKGVNFPKLNYFKVEQVKQFYYNTPKINTQLKQSAFFPQKPNPQEWLDKFQDYLMKLSFLSNLNEINEIMQFFDGFMKAGTNQLEFSMVSFCQKLLDLNQKYNSKLLLTDDYIEEVKQTANQQIEHQERQKVSFSQLLLTPDRESHPSRTFDEKQFYFKDSQEFDNKERNNKDIILQKKQEEIDQLCLDNLQLKQSLDEFEKQSCYLENEIKKHEAILEQQNQIKGDVPNKKQSTRGLQMKVLDDDL